MLLTGQLPTCTLEIKKEITCHLSFLAAAIPHLFTSQTKHDKVDKQFPHLYRFHVEIQCQPWNFQKSEFHLELHCTYPECQLLYKFLPKCVWRIISQLLFNSLTSFSSISGLNKIGIILVKNTIFNVFDQIVRIFYYLIFLLGSTSVQNLYRNLSTIFTIGIIFFYLF